MADEKLVLEFDPDDLTLEEAEALEETTGRPLAEIAVRFTRGQLSMKELIVLVWLARRREDPTFTIEDARRVRITSLAVSEPVPKAAGRRKA